MDLPISVIICTWNRASSLAETLCSLEKQKGYDVDRLEVIVVDNNSTDDTLPTVMALQKSWRLGRLRYLFEARQGKQFALNLGIAHAENTVLAFTDDDVLFPEDWLHWISQTFQEPEVEFVGGRTLIDWPLSGPPSWYHHDMQAVLAAVDLGSATLDPAPATYAPGGTNLIARKSLFDRVGGFSEAHYRHMDFEFGMRCHANSLRVIYEPRIVVRAPVDEKCLSLRYFRRWAFKAGIGRGGGIEAVGSGFPRLPAWLYRQFLEDAAATILCLGLRRTPERFSRELRMWRAWGAIANAWHAWLRPLHHAEWVKLKSQKSQNLY